MDPSFFKPLKAHYNQEAISWMKNHKERNMTRYKVGKFIGIAALFQMTDQDLK
jgi:hypothetical protein